MLSSVRQVRRRSKSARRLPSMLGSETSTVTKRSGSSGGTRPITALSGTNASDGGSGSAQTTAGLRSSLRKAMASAMAAPTVSPSGERWQNSRGRCAARNVAAAAWQSGVARSALRACWAGALASGPPVAEAPSSCVAGTLATGSQLPLLTLHLAHETQDAITLGNGMIEHKMQLGRVAQPQIAPQLVAQEAGRARERLHGLLLLVRRAHHGDKHLGVAQVRRHLNPCDRAQNRHTRIL